MILCVVLGFLLTYNCKGRNRAESELEGARQNVSALSDSLRIVRTRSGEIIAKKNALYCDLEEYEQLTNKQNKEIKKLQKQLKENIDYLSEVNLKVGRTDTFFIKEVEKVGDTISFAYKDTFRLLEGYISGLDSPKMALTKDLTKIGLKVGMSESGEIFATSDNPSVEFTCIDGALLSEEIRELKTRNEKRWSVGLSITGGVGMTYGIGGASAGVGIILGIGVQRKLIDF